MSELQQCWAAKRNCQLYLSHEMLNNLLEIYLEHQITVRHQSVCFFEQRHFIYDMCEVLKCMKDSKWYKHLKNCKTNLKEGRFMCVCVFYAKIRRQCIWNIAVCYIRMMFVGCFPEDAQKAEELLHFLSSVRRWWVQQC